MIKKFALFNSLLILLLNTLFYGCDKPAPPMPDVGCSIQESGYCIFEGSPHSIDTSIVNGIVADSEGNRVFSQGRPFQDGYQLVAIDSVITDPDELGYINVFRVMAPIRDAIMYDIEKLDEAEWYYLTEELRNAGIKLESENLDGTPKEQVYGIDDIYSLAKNPEGKIIHHPILKFLEESELYLKCLWTETDLTNPEGHDPCVEWREDN